MEVAYRMGAAQQELSFSLSLPRVSLNALSPDGVSAVHTSRGRMTHLMCRVQGMQYFHQGVERRTCLTRASHAGREGAQSSEKPVWQNKIASFSENSVAAVRTFPWEKVYGRFIQRVLDLVWTAVKWLAIPVLALSTLGELLYTLQEKKDIFIPLGMLTGVLLAKVVGNASLDVVKELQDERTSWPLIAMGMFFVLLKLPGPYYPSWAAAFLPHVANAGLVQTAFLLRESRQIFV